VGQQQCQQQPQQLPRPPRPRKEHCREPSPKGRGKVDRTTYKLTVSYYGPAFDGWMQQAGEEDASVEGDITSALRTLLSGVRPPMASGGRTDKGVTAAAQVGPSGRAWNGRGQARRRRSFLLQ
jgi:hypothetical protein